MKLFLIRLVVVLVSTVVKVLLWCQFSSRKCFLQTFCRLGRLLIRSKFFFMWRIKRIETQLLPCGVGSILMSLFLWLKFYLFIYFL